VLLGGAAGQLAQQGIGLTAGLGFLKMSREAEKQADLLGVGILYDAGYDPHGMSQFFETIQAKYGAGSAQFLSDHPNPGNRTEYVNKEIATFIPKSSYITTTPAFTRIHQTVSKMHAYTAKEISSGAWRRESPNQTVDGGVNEATASPAAVDLNTSGRWKTFRGADFSIDVPENWQIYGNQQAVMIAPVGGIGRAADGSAGNVVYGVLTDRYQPQAGMTVSAALDALVDEVVHDNPGLTPGRHTNVKVNGVSGHSVECENPAGNNGKGEHDWIVAFPQRNGSLRYFVFVAPTPDFEKLRPAFM
jgi:hypothetical protein